MSNYNKSRTTVYANNLYSNTTWAAKGTADYGSDITITLNTPAASNAMTVKLLDALQFLFQKLGLNVDIRPAYRFETYQPTERWPNHQDISYWDAPAYRYEIKGAISNSTTPKEGK